jgi:hypothetical protein
MENRNKFISERNRGFDRFSYRLWNPQEATRWIVRDRTWKIKIFFFVVWRLSFWEVWNQNIIFIISKHERKKGIERNNYDIFYLKQTFYDFYIKYHFTICKCTFILEKIFGFFEIILLSKNLVELSWKFTLPPSRPTWHHISRLTRWHISKTA